MNRYMTQMNAYVHMAKGVFIRVFLSSPFPKSRNIYILNAHVFLCVFSHCVCMCVYVLPGWCEQRAIDWSKAGQTYKHRDDPCHRTQVIVTKILQDTHIHKLNKTCYIFYWSKSTCMLDPEGNQGGKTKANARNAASTLLCQWFHLKVIILNIFINI